MCFCTVTIQWARRCFQQDLERPRAVNGCVLSVQPWPRAVTGARWRDAAATRTCSTQMGHLAMTTSCRRFWEEFTEFEIEGLELQSRDTGKKCLYPPPSLPTHTHTHIPTYPRQTGWHAVTSRGRVSRQALSFPFWLRCNFCLVCLHYGTLPSPFKCSKWGGRPANEILSENMPLKLCFCFHLKSEVPALLGNRHIRPFCQVMMIHLRLDELALLFVLEELRLRCQILFPRCHGLIYLLHHSQETPETLCTHRFTAPFFPLWKCFLLTQPDL